TDPRAHPLDIGARTTNDAVRDWNVIADTRCWPQGLAPLLGYDPAGCNGTISFWRERLHPEDRARVATCIRDALMGADEIWSGEYRFRHADGSYLHLLARAAIERGADGKATRF